MTEDTPSSPSSPDEPGLPSAAAGPAAPGLREGIYLEKKISTIGTGGTAQTAEYRSFWATGSIAEKNAVMVLLDDQFCLTGIRETFPHETITGPGWFFIDQGEKKYQQLRAQLDKMMAAKPASSAAAPAEAKPAAAKWWEGQAPSGPPKDPFALDKNSKKTAPTPKKGGWWEK